MANVTTIPPEWRYVGGLVYERRIDRFMARVSQHARGTTILAQVWDNWHIDDRPLSTKAHKTLPEAWAWADEALQARHVEALLLDAAAKETA